MNLRPHLEKSDDFQSTPIVESGYDNPLADGFEILNRYQGCERATEGQLTLNAWAGKMGRGHKTVLAWIKKAIERGEFESGERLDQSGVRRMHYWAKPLVEKEMHTCGSCHRELELVRPGKYQCNNKRCPGRQRQRG